MNPEKGLESQALETPDEELEPSLAEKSTHLAELHEKLEADSEDEELEKEFHREVMEALIELSLLYGEKRDEGNDGVILEVDVEKWPPSVKERFLDHFFADKNFPENKLAAKLIKIYTGTRGQREAEMHQKSYDVLQDVEDPENYAAIPELYAFDEMDIKSEELKARLTEAGVSADQQKIEVMVMDYINGEDLDTHIARRVLKSEPAFANEADDFSPEYARSTAANLLHLEKPKFTVRGPDGEVERRNDEKLVAFMKRKDIVLDPQVVDKVTNTLRLLNSNGIYHNDMHRRQVMVDTDAEGNITNVYLIDFGWADSKKREGVIADVDAIQKYKEITMSSAERKSAETRKFLEGVERLRKHVEKNAARNETLGNKYDELKERVARASIGTDESQAIKIKRLATEITGDQKWHELVGSIVMDLGAHDRREIKEYAESMRDGASRPYIQQFWAKLLKHI